jgi:predicted ATPase
MLLQDKSLKNVFLILSYRKDKAASFEGLLTKKVTAKVIDIEVGNLDARAVHQIISAVFETSSERTLELSELVLRKTQGNPLHAIQLIETINDD